MRTRRFKRHGIIGAFGQWLVTQRGIVNAYGPCRYDIDTVTLGAPWWSDYMGQKNWVVKADFDRALIFARQHFGIKAERSVLW